MFLQVNILDFSLDINTVFSLLRSLFIYQLQHYYKLYSIIYELSSYNRNKLCKFDYVLGVVTQIKASGGNQNHNPLHYQGTPFHYCCLWFVITFILVVLLVNFCLLVCHSLYVGVCCYIKQYDNLKTDLFKVYIHRQLAVTTHQAGLLSQFLTQLFTPLLMCVN